MMWLLMFEDFWLVSDLRFLIISCRLAVSNTTWSSQQKHKPYKYFKSSSLLQSIETGLQQRWMILHSLDVVVTPCKVDSSHLKPHLCFLLVLLLPHLQQKKINKDISFHRWKYLKNFFKMINLGEGNWVLLTHSLTQGVTESISLTEWI